MSVVPSPASPAVAYPMFVATHPSKNAKPFSYSTPPSGVTTPAQMRHFYGVDNVNLAGVVGDGRGQTIAIVDSYHDPNALSDLQHFDSFYGLPDPPSFLKYNQSGQLLNDSGGTGIPPSVGSTGNGWQIETSLDIQWAHVIAPAAKIALFEANSPSNTNLYAAVASAAALPNVCAISMSWGTNEFPGESSSDSNFTASGVVYLAATGDSGLSGTSYPAASANVVAVGGTTMHFASGTSDGTYGSETAWSGTGGRVSPYEAKPSYQNAVLAGTKRGTPDVSMEADPNTGVPIYDSYDFGNSLPWGWYGGTSLSTPMWAALVAIVDQGRAGAGLGNLSGRTGFLPALYAASGSDFHDVTSGSNVANGSNSAGPGYDTVTGLGTPIANKLLNDISGVAAGNKLVFTQPPSATVAGTAIGGASGVQVSVEDPIGNVVTGDSSTVTLTLGGGTFAGGGNTATAQAVNGVATFLGLVINAVGNYTLVATDGALGTAGSPSFAITPAAVASLTLATGPSNATAGSPISPAVVVKLFDAFGNLATTDTSSVTMNVVTGPGTISGTPTVQASGGSAVFSNLRLNTIGNYTIRPTDGAITGPTSGSFSITVGPAAKLAFVQQPADGVAGRVISPAVTLYVEDQGGNLITSVIPTVTLTLSSGTFADGSTTESTQAANGVAVFDTLKINDAGSYSMTATGGTLTSAVSDTFNLTVVDVVAANSGNQVALLQDPDGRHIDWSIGASAGAIPINDVNGLTLNGDGGSDHVYLDYTNGNPLPNTLHFNGTFTVDRLQGPSPLAGTTVEIGQSTLYFVYSNGSSPLAAIRAALAAGDNGGAWNGSSPATGVFNSSAIAGTPLNSFGIGFADGADGVVAGQQSNTVEVRYTLTGDANLDRTVDSLDAIQLGRNYLIAGRTAWDQGNFNYDAGVDLTDATLLQANMNAVLTVPTVTSAASGSGNGGPVGPSGVSATSGSTGSSSQPPAPPVSDDADATFRWRKSRNNRRWGL